MKLYLIAFGKIRTPGLREAADHYRQLLSSWVSLEELELKPLPVPDKSAATRTRIQEEEAALLLRKLASIPFYYLLDERGRPEPTLEWANRARSWEREGRSSLAICIGSSLGFSENLRKQARGLLGLGPHTLSHELARVVLMEQLYRAFSVVRGHPYHNEG